MKVNIKDREYNGIGFPEVLLLIFLTLKATGLIDWPWIWVFSPVWISLGLLAVFVSGLFIVKWFLDRKK